MAGNYRSNKSGVKNAIAGIGKTINKTVETKNKMKYFSKLQTEKEKELIGARKDASVAVVREKGRQARATDKAKQKHKGRYVEKKNKSDTEALEKAQAIRNKYREKNTSRKEPTITTTRQLNRKPKGKKWKNK